MRGEKIYYVGTSSFQCFVFILACLFASSCSLSFSRSTSQSCHRQRGINALFATSKRIRTRNCVGIDEEMIPAQQVLSSRRDMLKTTLLSTLITGSTITTNPNVSNGYEPDPDPLRESLYLISRVQEATVQQERFVRKANDQKALQNKMKLTLLLIEKNYKLVDQVTYCSTFIPSEHLVEATEAGNEAAEELQSAIDFVRSELKSGPLDQKQKDFITDALRTTRESLFIFLDFLPQDKLDQARMRVEEENKANIEEFDGDEDAGVYNPVMLPWKNRSSK